MSWAKKKPVKKSEVNNLQSEKVKVESLQTTAQANRDDRWAAIQMSILSYAPSMIPLIYLPVTDVYGRARVSCNGRGIYISEGFWQQPTEDCLFMILQEFTHVLLGHRLPNDVQITDDNINPRIAKLEVDMILTKVQNMLCNSILLHSPESVGVDRKLIHPSIGLLAEVYRSFGGYNSDSTNDFVYYMNSNIDLSSFIRRWGTMSVGMVHDQLVTGYKTCKANNKTKTYADIHFSISPSSTSYASKYMHIQLTPKGEFLIDIPADLIERLDNQISQNESGGIPNQQQTNSDGADNYDENSENTEVTDDGYGEYDEYGDELDGDSFVSMTPTEFGQGGGGAEYIEGNYKDNLHSRNQHSKPTVEQLTQEQMRQLLTSMDEEDLLKMYDMLDSSMNPDSVTDILNEALDDESDMDIDMRDMLTKYMEENNLIPMSEDLDSYDDMAEFQSLLNREESEMPESLYKDIVLDSKRFLEESSDNYSETGVSYGNRVNTAYNDLYKVSTVWWKKAQSMIMGYVPDVNSSYRRPNKRYIMLGYILPSRCEKSEDYEVDRLRVFLDSSGSMSDEDFFIFKSLIKSSQRYFPQETKAYEFNTRVTQMKCVKGKIIGEPKGTGGTNINCVTQFIKKQPERLKTLNIIVTDGGFNWTKLTQYMKEEDSLSKFIFILTKGSSRYKEATKAINPKRLKVLLINSDNDSRTLKWR